MLFTVYHLSHSTRIIKFKLYKENCMEKVLTNSLSEKAPIPFIPQKLPFDYTGILSSNVPLIKLLNDATQAIGEYKGYLSNVINPSLLISPLINQEAVISSKLEGTHATLEDLLNYDANIQGNVDRDELKEVANYRKALFYALETISTISKADRKLPLSGRVIREMHKILLDNARGETKRPGEYKRQQNYIVSANGVVFTPLPANLVNDYIDNLEQYIHYEDFNILLQTAVIHCQFEMIHPFEDGNGRIGRLLIPLFLYYRELLPLPTFYMSSYFNKDRSLYLESLNSVSSSNDWNRWFTYFLNGIIYSSHESTKKAIQINELYEKMKTKIVSEAHSSHDIPILDYIFEHPVFKAKQISIDLHINLRTMYTIIRRLVSEKFITTDGNKRNITYVCIDLIKLL